MLDEVRLPRLKLSLADAVENRLAQLPVCRRTLRVGYRAGFDIAGRKVGKGAANIDGDDIGHGKGLPSVVARALVDRDAGALDHVGPLRDSLPQHSRDV